MDPGLYHRARELFLEVLDLVPDDRVERIRVQCAGEPALQALVLSLLAGHEAGGDSIEGGLLARALEPEFRSFPLPKRVGRFELGAEIGRGGMGVVFRAEDPARGEEVAVKLLRPELVSDTTLRRFEREAAALSQLEHSGIVRHIEVGTYASGDMDVPYLAMEWVDGMSILAHAASTRLTAALRLTLLVEVAEAMTFAHSRGFVHRDLKPANILIDSSGQPRVLDFGIASDLGVDTTRLTSTGQVMGTVSYMSPEQAAGKASAVDGRTDVWALAKIGFELLAEAPPFDVPATSMGDAFAAVLSARPSLLGDVAAQYRGTPIERVLRRALEPAREDRYASMSDFLYDLKLAQVGMAPEIAGRGRASRALRRLRRSRTRLALVGVALALIVVAVVQGVGMLQRSRAEVRDIDARYEALYQVVDEAEQLFAEGGRSEDRVTAAIAKFEEAKDLLRFLPERPERQVLFRLVFFRLGTTHMVRAGRNHSYDDLLAASQALEWCLAVAPSPEGFAAVAALDSTHTWRQAAIDESPIPLFATASGVYRDLARYRTPRAYLSRAKELDLLGFQALAEFNGWTFRDPLSLPGRGLQFLLLHSQARNLLMEADLTGDASFVDEALLYLRKAAITVGDAPSPRGSILASIGDAYALRGRLTQSAADFDSAEVRRIEVLGLAPESRSRVLHGWRCLAAAEGRLDRAETLNAALVEPVEVGRWVEKAGQIVAADADSVGLSEVAVVRAKLVRVTWSSCSELELAADLLSGAQTPLRSAGLSLASARVAFEEAKTLAMLASCPTDPTSRAAAGVEARIRIREVLESVHPDDWPRLHREAYSVLAELE
ncbi:MAG: protein kinase [Candidatus Eisenbacteria bacterium]|uniref:Protein kinase n=1 Tax=Eiseniibacteriota bacterium TaxID=2212470 RepID=A0A956SG51_UNCEI|nr:protein kinase [Candidatus Eisenbacteria bacterium]